MELDKVYLGDALEVIRSFPDESVDCVVTSPPYFGLRDYGTGTWVGGDPNCNHYRDTKASDKVATGHKRMQEAGSPVGDAIYRSVCPKCGAVREDKQIGLEDTPDEYVERLVLLFREIRRVLKKEGTLWVNIGDSYNNTAPGNKTPHGFSQNRPSYINYEDKKMRDKRLVDGLKRKDLIGIPWMLAFALRSDGWYLRQDIIWHKPNPMPESVTDRCTKSHEYIFLFSKSEKYYFDHEAIQEEAVTNEGRPPGVVRNREFGYDSKENLHPDAYLKPRWGNGSKRERTNNQGHAKKENGGHRDNSGGFDCDMVIRNGVVFRNKRDVWTVTLTPTKEAHFATYPQLLVKPCVLAGCPEGGVVLDPFMGSGTTGIVAMKLGRHYVGTELNPEYQQMATRRIAEEGVNLFFGMEGTQTDTE